MPSEQSVRRYRRWYAKLLRLYPRPYHERFGEGMEQTFNDLLRERAAEERGLAGRALRMFVETSAAIIRQNATVIMMQNTTKRLMVWTVIVALLLMIPALAMQFTGEVSWDLTDFTVMGALLFGIGLAYELVARRASATMCRVAIGVALVTAFLLSWMNGAVGIIGNEGNPANLMYIGVLAVGVIGAFIARFEPRGLARAFFAVAIAQMLAPVIALIVWPPRVTSWGAAGVFGVFILNAFFATMFGSSAMLLRRASAGGAK